MKRLIALISTKGKTPSQISKILAAALPKPKTSAGAGQYTVEVDDNYHFMDESERYKKGTYDSYAEAVRVCQEIVDRSFTGPFAAGITAEQLYASYTQYGEDPFIIDETPNGGIVEFSAWDYAKSRAEVVAREAKE